MRRYSDTIELSRLYGHGKSLAHRAHWLAVPFHDSLLRDAKPMPAPKMGQQPVGQPHWRLPLFGLSSAIGAPMEYATIKIDKSAPDRRHEGSATDRTMSGPGVQTDQN